MFADHIPAAVNRTNQMTITRSHDHKFTILIKGLQALLTRTLESFYWLLPCIMRAYKHTLIPRTTNRRLSLVSNTKLFAQYILAVLIRILLILNPSITTKIVVWFCYHQDCSYGDRVLFIWWV